MNPLDFSEATLSGSHTRTIRSEIVGHEYELQILPPFPAHKEGRVYPVLYLLDPTLTFGTVVNHMWLMQAGRELPRVLVVGIGYPGSQAETMHVRLRDYTPVDDPAFYGLLVTRFKEESGVRPGGSADFLRFIREELKPFVEANYPADPDDSAILGLSAGGTFVLTTLLTQPDTFQRYVAGSPPMAWGDRVTMALEAQYAERHDDLPARVFLAAGSLETDGAVRDQIARWPEPARGDFQAHFDHYGWPMTVELLNELAERLRRRGYPRLDLSMHLFEDETHMSVLGPLISRGLRVIYAEDS